MASETTALSLDDDYSSMWEYNSDDGDPDYYDEPQTRRPRTRAQRAAVVGTDVPEWHQYSARSVNAETDFYYSSPELAAHQQYTQPIDRNLLTPPEKFALATDSNYGQYDISAMAAQARLDIPSPLPSSLGHHSSDSDHSPYGSYACASNLATQSGYLPNLQRYMAQQTSPRLSASLQYFEDPDHSSYASVPEPNYYRTPQSSPPPRPAKTTAPSQKQQNFESGCRVMKCKLPKFAPASAIGKFGKINMRTSQSWKRSPPSAKRKITHPAEPKFYM